jgi:hypothetical protein
MIISHKKGMKQDGTNPTILMVMEVLIFLLLYPDSPFLMQNGGIYAVANQPAWWW